jgi:hypothetical protein
MTETRKALNKGGVPSIGTLIVLLLAFFMLVSSVQPMGLKNTVEAKSYETITEERAAKMLALEENPVSEPASAPSTLALDDGGEFKAQADLITLYATQSNNIVKTRAQWEIVFYTQTTGTIHRIDMTFPEGTVLTGRQLNEKLGIGPGTLTATGNTVSYIVKNPVEIPAGTYIRFEIGALNNPPTGGVPLTITITTRGALNNVIDGPTETNAFFMKQIQSDQLANGAVTTDKLGNGAVTSSKLSSSFMVSRILNDGQNGWSPDGLAEQFTIGDAAVKLSNSHVYVSVDEPSDVGPLAVNVVCMVEDISNGAFEVVCDVPPSDGSKLRYTVINQP